MSTIFMPFEQQSDKDLRQWPRVQAPGSKPIKADLGPAGAGLLLDISGGGIRVQSIAPLRRGVEIPVRIELPDGSAPIHSSGTVVWSKSSATAGIQFADLTPDQRKAIESWLVEAAKSPATNCKDEKDFSSILAEIQATRLNNSDALRLIARRTVELTPAAGAAIVLGTRENMVRVVSVGEAPEQGLRITINTGIIGECARRRKLVYCQNSENDPRIPAAAKKEFNFGSAVILPLSIHGDLRGFLKAFSPKPYAFNAKSIEILEKLADTVVIVAHEFTPQPFASTTILSTSSTSATAATKKIEAPLLPSLTAVPTKPVSAVIRAANVVDISRASRSKPEPAVIAGLVAHDVKPVIDPKAERKEVPAPVAASVENVKPAVERAAAVQPKPIAEAAPNVEVKLEQRTAVAAPSEPKPPSVPEPKPAAETPIVFVQPLVPSAAPAPSVVMAASMFPAAKIAAAERTPEPRKPVEAPKVVETPKAPTPVKATVRVLETPRALEAQKPTEAPKVEVAKPAPIAKPEPPTKVESPVAKPYQIAPAATAAKVTIRPKQAPVETPLMLGIPPESSHSPILKWGITAAAAIILAGVPLFMWQRSANLTPTVAAATIPANSATVPTPSITPVALTQTVSAQPSASKPAISAPASTTSAPEQETLAKSAISPTNSPAPNVSAPAPIMLAASSAPVMSARLKEEADTPTPNPLTAAAGSQVNAIGLPANSSVPKFAPVQSKVPTGGAIIKKVAPVYPPVARSLGVEGEVQLSVHVNKDGSVSDVRRVSGPVMLATPAIDAVRQWKYEPTRVEGEPVESVKSVTLRFTK